ncbi:MAG: nuclear transport factor 2 family protein [Deltaproteobacteria bacterium]|nr:nuclear transport factor 2 family protein [Deltaproteobacteria bacterium]
MFKCRCVPVAILGFTILACSSVQEPVRPSAEEDLAAIADARARLQAALASDDVPGIIAELADGHLTMAPNGSAPPDNQALADWHQARVDQFSFESAFTTDDIQLFGDIAIERFSGDSRLVPREGGDDVVDSTKGVWIWERQEDGSWKILWSIWNSNLPVGAN